MKCSFPMIISIVHKFTRKLDCVFLTQEFLVNDIAQTRPKKTPTLVSGSHFRASVDSSYKLQWCHTLARP